MTEPLRIDHSKESLLPLLTFTLKRVACPRHLQTELPFPHTCFLVAFLSVGGTRAIFEYKLAAEGLKPYPVHDKKS